MRTNKVEWDGQGALKQIPISVAKTGVYLVVIETGAGKYSEKVIL